MRSERLYNIVNRFRQRPQILIGGHGITALSHFVLGYSMALHELPVISKRSLLPLPFDMLNAFVAYKCDDSRAEGWGGLLLRWAHDNEGAALEEFFRLYDQYCTMKAVQGWAAALTEANRFHHCSDPHAAYRGATDSMRLPLYSDPSELIILEMENAGYLMLVGMASGWHLNRSFHPDKEACKRDFQRDFGALLWQPLPVTHPVWKRSLLWE